MKKDAYHHGELKKDMIAKGLLLLNKGGYEAFSLRKLAALCHVSHAAPYKHFKNKEELLLAIKTEVLEKFKCVLEATANEYLNNPKKQIINLGKCYVKFMVDNPDYLKFIVSFRQYYRPLVIIKDKQLRYETNTEGTYDVFTKSAVNYLRSLNSYIENPLLEILTMWSVVHGLAMLFANKSIVYSGDYLDIVEKILTEKLSIGGIFQFQKFK